MLPLAGVTGDAASVWHLGVLLRGDAEQVVVPASAPAALGGAGQMCALTGAPAGARGAPASCGVPSAGVAGDAAPAELCAARAREAQRCEATPDAGR